MDIFDAISKDLTDVFSSKQNVEDPLSSVLQTSPSHSSDSIDLIPEDNDFIHFTDFENFTHEYELQSNVLLTEFDCLNPDSIISPKHAYQVSSRDSLSTITQLDHPYSLTEESSVSTYSFYKSKPDDDDVLEEQPNSPDNDFVFKTVESAKPLEILPNGKLSYTDENGKRHIVDRTQKNAVMAKLNRRRKKRYTSNLEAEVKSLRTRNDKLIVQKSRCDKKIEALEKEVCYLRTVLKNKTMLSTLVKTISQIPDIEFKYSEKENRVQDKPHQLMERLPGKRGPVSAEDQDFTGGVCLHVSNNKVAIEFCADCNRMSSQSGICNYITDSDNASTGDIYWTVDHDCMVYCWKRLK